MKKSELKEIIKEVINEEYDFELNKYRSELKKIIKDVINNKPNNKNLAEYIINSIGNHGFDIIKLEEKS